MATNRTTWTELTAEQVAEEFAGGGVDDADVEPVEGGPLSLTSAVQTGRNVEIAR